MQLNVLTTEFRVNTSRDNHSIVTNKPKILQRHNQWFEPVNEFLLDAYLAVTDEVFANNTKLTFLYKIDIRVLKVSVKNKITFSGNWTHNWTWLVYKSDAYPTVLSKHVLNRRCFKLNFVSCTTSLFGLESFLASIEHDFINIKIWKSETGKAWQISTVG